MLRLATLMGQFTRLHDVSSFFRNIHWMVYQCLDGNDDLTCKRGSVGQSEGLSIPISSVWFRLKPENSNSHGFELHRPSNKCTKLLKVIKAIIIIQYCRHHQHCRPQTRQPGTESKPNKRLILIWGPLTIWCQSCSLLTRFFSSGNSLCLCISIKIRYCVPTCNNPLNDIIIHPISVCRLSSYAT